MRFYSLTDFRRHKKSAEGGRKEGQNPLISFNFQANIVFFMLDTKELRVRLNDEQYARIKTKAQLSGFNTLSGYARDRLLRVNYQMQKRLTEIYEALKRSS